MIYYIHIKKNGGKAMEAKERKTTEAKRRAIYKYINVVAVVLGAVKMLKTPPDGLKSRTAGVKFFNRLC